jgi:hypothetical protein
MTASAAVRITVGFIVIGLLEFIMANLDQRDAAPDWSGTSQKVRAAIPFAPLSRVS